MIRCDSCGARARWEGLLPSGRPLVFCDHCHQEVTGAQAFLMVRHLGMDELAADLIRRGVG